MTDKERIRAEIDLLQQQLLFIEMSEQMNNSLPEEPVSDDLEEAVNSYIGHKPDVDESSSVYGKRQAFKAGANWQKEQMMKDVIDVEVKVDAGGYPYIDKTIELYDYDKDVPLAKAGEKVKVIIMKEDNHE